MAVFCCLNPAGWRREMWRNGWPNCWGKNRVTPWVTACGVKAAAEKYQTGSRDGRHTDAHAATGPELDGVSLVILDEFHERSLQGDLALALLLDVQGGLRDDLKLLIMSATLDNSRLQQWLPEAPFISSEGRSFPVERRYSPLRPTCVSKRRWRVQAASFE